MTSVTFHGNPITISGRFPVPGDIAPPFSLCGTDLGELTLAQQQGKIVVLSIFPSIDTGVCATAMRKFNQALAKAENTVVLCISADLPFAAKRFCAAEGIDGVQTASFFRAPEFTENYGVHISDGPLRELASRAVIVIAPDGKVAYSEFVKEITDEPNYDGAIAAVKALNS